MPRSLVLGNGGCLVCIDDSAQVRDVYFHYVGQENHVRGHQHRIGIWVDGEFSWIHKDEKDWHYTFGYKKETLLGDIKIVNKVLGIELVFTDCVYNEKDLFIREVEVNNLKEEAREVRIFFRQEFQIAENKQGNTVYFDPKDQAMIHYKGRRVFLINGEVDGHGISDYTTGSSHAHGSEGSWKDAEDGGLERVAVKHGAVDSTIGFFFNIEGTSKKKVYYWMTMALGVIEAQALNHYILEKSPAHLIKTTGNYWNAWVNKREFDFGHLTAEMIKLFKQSLLIIRTHVDNHGAIIASGDSDMLQYGRDAYSYMWPRDGAFVAMALDKAGYYETTHEFFVFCHDVIAPEGYLMHKFLCDRALGSSWHTWVNKEGKPHLPIQEDETALVLIALWNHYEKNRDLEFIEEVYNPLIKKAANFLCEYRDERTKLPRPSYDLWETLRGVSTFTAGTVYGGLKAATKFARLLGKHEQSAEFDKAAEEVKKAIEEHLWDEEHGFFIKNLSWTEDGEKIIDERIDASSFFGIVGFDVFPVDDPRVIRAAAVLKEKLSDTIPAGGFARVEGDPYYKTDSDAPGNPWIICTMWYAQYLIKNAGDEAGLKEALHYMQWVVDRASEAGILAEQFDPETAEPVSVSPLIWSHAAYVQTVMLYLERLEHLGVVKRAVCI